MHRLTESVSSTQLNNLHNRKCWSCPTSRVNGYGSVHAYIRLVWRCTTHNICNVYRFGFIDVLRGEPAQLKILWTMELCVASTTTQLRESNQVILLCRLACVYIYIYIHIQHDWREYNTLNYTCVHTRRICSRALPSWRVHMHVQLSSLHDRLIFGHDCSHVYVLYDGGACEPYAHTHYITNEVCRHESSFDCVSNRVEAML